MHHATTAENVKIRYETDGTEIEQRNALRRLFTIVSCADNVY